MILPSLLPAIITGFALAFARGLGEYGSVVFVSGNMPFKTEIAPVLIVASLEEFDYGEATAIAVVLLIDLVLDAGRSSISSNAGASAMAADVTSAAAPPRRRAQDDPPLVRWALIAAALLVIGVLVVVPLVNVFYEALRARPRRLLGQPGRRPRHAAARSC